MSVLVTGSTGFLGRNLVNCLNKDKRSIHLFCHDTKQADITHFESIKHELKGIETIFHLAAILNYRNSNDGLMIEVNTTGTRNVLEAAVQANVKNVIYVSTQDVYGKVATPFQPVPEDFVARPVTTYGKSKLDGEEYCNYYARRYSLKIAIARVAVVYGEGMHPESIIYNYIREAMKEKKIDIYGSGNRIYDLVFIDDVVKALIKMEGRVGIYNIGGGQPYSTKEIAERISSVVPCELCFNTNIKEQKGFYLDITKAKIDLNFYPTNLNVGLKETVEKWNEG